MKLLRFATYAVACCVMLSSCGKNSTNHENEKQLGNGAELHADERRVDEVAPAAPATPETAAIQIGDSLDQEWMKQDKAYQAKLNSLSLVGKASEGASVKFGTTTLKVEAAKKLEQGDQRYFLTLQGPSAVLPEKSADPKQKQAPVLVQERVGELLLHKVVEPKQVQEQKGKSDPAKPVEHMEWILSKLCNAEYQGKCKVTFTTEGRFASVLLASVQTNEQGKKGEEKKITPPPQQQEQKKVTPPVKEEKKVTPPPQQEQKKVTPPPQQEQKKVTPPVQEQKKVTPPPQQEQKKVTPPVKEEKKVSPPPQQQVTPIPVQH